MKRFQLVTIAILCLSACSPKVDNGGYVKDADIKDEVTVGQTTKDEVTAKLGSPSSQSSFGQETWYYITNRKEAIGFMKPDVVQQDVTSITFDNAGVVSDVKNYNKGDSKDIDMVKRSTPTEGHELGFFEQLIGNIGRFNRPGGASETAAPGRRGGGY